MNNTRIQKRVLTVLAALLAIPTFLIAGATGASAARNPRGGTCTKGRRQRHA